MAIRILLILSLVFSFASAAAPKGHKKHGTPKLIFTVTWVCNGDKQTATRKGDYNEIIGDRRSGRIVRFLYNCGKRHRADRSVTIPSRCDMKITHKPNRQSKDERKVYLLWDL